VEPVAQLTQGVRTDLDGRMAGLVGRCRRLHTHPEFSMSGGCGGCRRRAAPRWHSWAERREDGHMKLKLDLHDIFNRGQDIDRALRGIIDEAIAKKATLVEIIPGKGSGQLKKRVLRFLDQKEIKALYHRVEKDSQNWGRLFIHFRWK
jgi:hypothetical protein